LLCRAYNAFFNLKGVMAMFRIFTALLVGSLLAGGALAQSLVAEGAEVKAVAENLLFGEGPAWNGEDTLYFTDIPRSRINMIGPDGEVSIFTDDSGGTNGLYFDAEGNLFCCESVRRQLVKRTPSGEIVVVATGWDGKQFNQPNDVWVAPNGGLYMTDPVYRAVPDREIEGTNVYYISPDYTSVSLAAEGMNNPNGLIGTPDGKILYITAHGDKQTWVFDIEEDGSLANKRLLTDRGSDGMTLDIKGNIYLTGSGGVEVFSPEGESLEMIATPESTTNVTFGGASGRTLYITCPKAVYAVEMSVQGW
jgi:gluconolactonase